MTGHSESVTNLSNHIETPHETSDAQPLHIYRFGVFLVVLVALSLAAMAWLFSFFTERESRIGEERSPLAEEFLPPSPQLQADPSVELQQLRAREAELLNSYGWVNQDQGLIRIPIEEAMDLVASSSQKTGPGGASDEN